MNKKKLLEVALELGTKGWHGYYNENLFFPRLYWVKKGATHLKECTTEEALAIQEYIDKGEVK